jgi:Holliday junction resolvasome RuvABC endonuclease subunit
MKILALDPATVTGFCTSTTSGVWNLKTKSYESKGMRLIKMRSSIDEICKAEGITFIVYEKPGGRNYNALKSHSNFEGIIQAYALDNGIEYKGYSASEIKKFATGKGNANKQAMIDACIKTYGFTPEDDNQADAVHLYNLAKSEFKI